jgi:hypothetical protein
LLGRCGYISLPQLLEDSQQSKVLSGEIVNPTRPLFVWGFITFDLSGIGGAISSYPTDELAPRII